MPLRARLCAGVIAQRVQLQSPPEQYHRSSPAPCTRPPGILPQRRMCPPPRKGPRTAPCALSAPPSWRRLWSWRPARPALKAQSRGPSTWSRRWGGGGETMQWERRGVAPVAGKTSVRMLYHSSLQLEAKGEKNLSVNSCWLPQRAQLNAPAREDEPVPRSPFLCLECSISGLDTLLCSCLLQVNQFSLLENLLELIGE